MVDQLSYLLFQSVFSYWCNKSCGMCYSFSGMVHIKDSLLLIKKTQYLNGSVPYVRRHIILNKMCLVSSLNKTFPSFLLFFVSSNAIIYH